MSVTKKVPQRQCTGCGEMKNKKEMIRVIKTLEDEILIDKTGKKNGRGAYICNSPECFRKAVKNRGLERSLKVSIPQEVYEELEKELIGLES
ncbi:RNase P modulator RnpM [Anaerocolumna sp.]|uniref:RNase P modulator RnpM n=1 Tax=Anaerocolumna sp. TaxID=2041569 RepID=UPI0028B10AC4|nr:YlxR family protein [Anaerocolumna sp.]